MCFRSHVGSSLFCSGTCLSEASRVHLRPCFHCVQCRLSRASTGSSTRSALAASLVSTLLPPWTPLAPRSRSCWSRLVRACFLLSWQTCSQRNCYLSSNMFVALLQSIVGITTAMVLPRSVSGSQHHRRLRSNHRQKSRHSSARPRSPLNAVMLGGYTLTWQRQK